MNPSAPAPKKVLLGSLPEKTMRKMAEAVLDPEAKAQAIAYVDRRERDAARARKLQRTRAKAARKVNRRSR